MRLEAGSYNRQFEEQLISREIHADLMRNREQRSAKVANRPTLDLGLDMADVIDRVPLFREMPQAGRRHLAQALCPGLALPGEAIVSKGRRGRRMYFVVAGEVLVELPGGVIRLGPGAFFGEMALLSRAPRSATVRAEGYCHLLVLDDQDFCEVIRRDPALRQHFEEIAASRREPKTAKVEVDPLSLRGGLVRNWRDRAEHCVGRQGPGPANRGV